MLRLHREPEIELARPVWLEANVWEWPDLRALAEERK